MIQGLSDRLQYVSWKAHGFLLGMSLAGGAMLAGQGCAASGG
jgi:hypothetical protein